jgi:hypothetical protein
MSDTYTRIFLLSHMRAYSSLIGHILGSHPAINGYYEMHQSYGACRDLEQQLINYRQHDNIKPGSHYLFDKLLHNDYSIDLSLPELRQAIVLVALRNPEQSIKSIVQLFRNKQGRQRFADPLQAIHYYLQRLKNLSEFCQQHVRRYYYFDAEMIRDNSDQTLATLTRWLMLPTPLSAHYKTFTRTGKERAGDSSAQIKSGHIINQVNNYDMIDLDKNDLTLAQNKYAKARRLIQKNSINF